MTQPPATPPPVKYLSFSASINQETTDGLIRVMTDYHNQGIPEVHVALSTQGGNVLLGIQLYNYLRGLPFELTMHNVGFVASVGIILFLAGDRRYASPHATFMFHGVGFTWPQGQRLDEPELVSRLKSVRSDQTRLGSIIQERTNLGKQTVAGLFGKAETKDVAWAKEHGFIEGIRELQIRRGDPFDTLIQEKRT